MIFVASIAQRCRSSARFRFPSSFFFSGGGENKRERANDVFIIILVSDWHHLLTSEARVGRYRGYGLYPGSFDGEAERRVLLSVCLFSFLHVVCDKTWGPTSLFLQRSRPMPPSLGQNSLSSCPLALFPFLACPCRAHVSCPRACGGLTLHRAAG